MAVEAWSEIEGTDYSVSDQGRVMSHKHGKGRILKTGADKRGYPSVNLFTNGVGKSRTVHTLVAEAFLGPRPTPRHEIDHKDENKENNRAGNLHWCTHGENLLHRSTFSPRASQRRRLTESQVREARARIAAGESQAAVASLLGVSRPHINMIAKGKKWAWLPQEA